MRRANGRLTVAFLLCLVAQTSSATDEAVPDIALLAFLGTIAGLESMGVEIDELLAGTEAESDASDAAEEHATAIGPEEHKGESNE